MDMMFQLALAYLFAAGLGVTMVYLAAQNRKQGWQRPAPKWFGVELEAGEATRMPAPLVAESDPAELLPQLLQLNRELASHGTPVKPAVEAPATPELVAVGAPDHVSNRRV